MMSASTAGDWRSLFEERGGLRRIEAELDGDVLSGTVELDGEALPVHLVRVIPMSERLAARTGLYRLADGETSA
jgi:hypothetical protein